MGGFYDRAIAFFITLPSAVLVGVCVVIIIHRMISADLAVVHGIVAMGVLLATLALCVRPPHPMFPILAWVAILALMLTYPFAETQLIKVQLRDIDVEKLERSYNALAARPDNAAAAFEVAKQLYAFGFVEQAIAIAESTLMQLSQKVDSVTNASFRDAFRAEQVLVNRWKHTPVPAPPPTARRCSCGAENPAQAIVCQKCGRPYMLEKVRAINPGKRFAGKLALTWILIAAAVVGGGALAMSAGSLAIPAIFVVLAIVGGLLYWLFRIPSAGASVKQPSIFYGE